MLDTHDGGAKQRRDDLGLEVRLTGHAAVHRGEGHVREGAETSVADRTASAVEHGTAEAITASERFDIVVRRPAEATTQHPARRIGEHGVGLRLPTIDAEKHPRHAHASASTSSM